VPNWISEHWLSYLQRELLLLPMTPGQRKSAERGDARLSFARGTITAKVEVGHAGATETATMKFKPFGQREWRRLEEAIAADPGAARRLLSGGLGPELEEVFNRAGLSLFPAGHGRQFRCTCRERWGCRHQRVLAVRAARMFDANPFLWLEVLGRPREELLAGVRTRLADQSVAATAGAAQNVTGGQTEAADTGSANPGPAVSSFWLDPERFLETGADPAGIPVRPGEAPVPDALLKVLGPLPLPPQLNRTRRYELVQVTRWGQTFTVHQAVEETAEQVLARYYAAISAGAAALARGECAPAYREEPLPGKRIPLQPRLAAEIQAVVDEREGAVALQDLVRSCPTAAALPGESALQTVRDAAAALPGDYRILADRYVGRRDKLLSGATFRHVITWPEWQARRLSPSGDWFRALRLAGFKPPFAVEFAAADGTAGAAGRAAGTTGGPESRTGGGTGAETAQPALLCIDSAGFRTDTDPVFAVLQPAVGDELLIAVAQAAPLRLVIRLRRRAERNPWEPLPADQAAARVLSTAIAPDPYRGLTEAEAIQLLLAEGFYRPDRMPDPVWLLPSPAVGESLQWGSGRRLVTSYWGRSALLPGSTPPYWRDGGQLTAGFARHLAELRPHEQRAASALVEAWAQRWSGNPLDPIQRPPLAAFLHFLLHRVPVIARQTNIPAEVALGILDGWFRYLVQLAPAMAEVYAPFTVACAAVEPIRHRLETLPRLHTAEFELWEMEGFRWLGPELSL